ncbi:MAG: hypothetical protein OXR66_03155 [Candidatus Woesearchaeota archaeon]|nr:hypothetical protein [Candidatus Woesearchaeota archaeon]
MPEPQSREAAVTRLHSTMKFVGSTQATKQDFFQLQKLWGVLSNTPEYRGLEQLTFSPTIVGGVHRSEAIVGRNEVGGYMLQLAPGAPVQDTLAEFPSQLHPGQHVFIDMARMGLIDVEGTWWEPLNLRTHYGSDKKLEEDSPGYVVTSTHQFNGTPTERKSLFNSYSSMLWRLKAGSLNHSDLQGEPLFYFGCAEAALETADDGFPVSGDFRDTFDLEDSSNYQSAQEINALVNHAIEQARTDGRMGILRPSTGGIQSSCSFTQLNALLAENGVDVSSVRHLESDFGPYNGGFRNILERNYAAIVDLPTCSWRNALTPIPKDALTVPEVLQ